MSIMEEDTVQPDDPKAARVWVVRCILRPHRHERS